jgi:hypothetical protein
MRGNRIEDRRPPHGNITEPEWSNAQHYRRPGNSAFVVIRDELKLTGTKYG